MGGSKTHRDTYVNFAEIVSFGVVLKVVLHAAHLLEAVGLKQWIEGSLVNFICEVKLVSK